MGQLITPKNSDWDHFWQKDPAKDYAKVSWSKKRIINLINPFLKKGNRALDAGCGSGFFAKYFCDEGMKTVALDYSDQALAIAEKVTQGKAQIVKADLLSPFLTNDLEQGIAFDVIFSDGLLEHFTKNDQDKIFQNFRKLLAPRGVLITFVPNRWSPWELIRPFFMPGIDEKPFTLSQLVELNTKNGFKLLNQGGINTFPFVLSPDSLLGKYFGMLLFTISVKNVY